MPSWIVGSGFWRDAANWSGGIPDAVGATADFSFSLSGSLFQILLQGETTVGTLNVTQTGTNGIQFFGQSGVGGGHVLVFSNGSFLGIPRNAHLNVDTQPGGGLTRFDSINGLSMRLDSRLDANIVNAGTTTQFNLPVTGTHGILKSGAGTLELNGVNSFSGGIQVAGGTLVANSDSALGSGGVTVSDNGIFRSTGTIDNTFATVSGATAAAGSGRITSTPNQTMTLTGTLNHMSQGTLRFGTPSDNNSLFPTVIEAGFSVISHNATLSGMELAGGTLRFVNAFNAGQLFAFAGSGLTLISGTLDTNGIATTISNLDMELGTIRSTGGPLNLVVNHNSDSLPFQSGAIQGTAGSDLVVFRGSWVALGELNFTSWTPGIDLIQINGTAGVDALGGSGQADEILGFDGDDLLWGWGGADTIDGGNGNDTIYLIGANTGALVTGNAGTDTLEILGNENLTALGAISGFEAVKLNTGASLTLTGAQFAAGLAANTVLTGAGTLIINMTAGTSLQTNGFNFAGFTGAMTINGSTGDDVLKLGAYAHTVNAGDGNDQVRGGSGADIINGGNGTDKINGGFGTDLLTGGTGADKFRFGQPGVSGLGAAADKITDFEIGIDILGFGGIDADANTPGDQAFAFLGTGAFHAGGVGEIRYATVGSDLRVEVDINGDGFADMHVILLGLGGQTLTSGDFAL